MALIHGVVAAIKWNYYVAAKIYGYDIARGAGPGGTWSVVATVVERDDYKLSQRPLIFAAVTDKGGWFWPIQTYTLTASGRFVAQLGPPIT